MSPDIRNLYLYCIDKKIMMFKKENDLYFTIHVFTRGNGKKTAFTINGEEWYSIELNNKRHLIAGVNDNNHMDDISDLDKNW